MNLNSLSLSCSLFNYYTFSSKTQGLNSVFLGILNDVAWKFGTFGFSLQNNLFQTNYANGSTSSIDLLAFNVNRGRDQ